MTEARAKFYENEYTWEYHCVRWEYDKFKRWAKSCKEILNTRELSEQDRKAYLSFTNEYVNKMKGLRKNLRLYFR